MSTEYDITNETFLLTDEAAEIIRVKPNTLRGWLRQGTGPRHIQAGTGHRCIRLIRKSDLMAWNETRRSERRLATAGH